MNHAGLIDLVPRELRQNWVTRGLYANESVYTLFCQQVVKHPELAAVSTLGHSLSYAQLLDQVKRLARQFKTMGIVAGDVIAYALPNSWQCCAIDLAAAALGAVVAPFPVGRGRLDIDVLLRRCSARLIIMETQHGDLNIAELIEALRPTLLCLRILVTDSNKPRAGWYNLTQLFDGEPITDDELPSVCPDSPVRFLISSGTEAEPKWVAYSHNALVGGRGRFLQRLHQSEDYFSGFYLMPLGTAFGSSATFGILSWLGGTVVLLPEFNVERAIQAIAELKPHYIFGVPTMFQRMAAEAALVDCDKSSLRAIISGGAKIDEASIRRCMAAFGCGFISLYGSADGVNCHTLLSDDVETILSKLGKPNADVCEIRIIDEHGQEVTHGAVGEITARGPMSPLQYVNAPELDALYRCADGWVYTGDLGFMDAGGYLILSGRKKDIIIRGGANISPVQIEHIAVSHPDVVSAACVPVSDPDMGHRICLCLVMRNDAPRPSLSEFTRYLSAQGLEKNKLPEYLRYYRQLPLSPAGKVDKKQLTAEVECIQSFIHVNNEAGAVNVNTQ